MNKWLILYPFSSLAQDSEERRKWVKNLEETILKHSGDGVVSAFDNASMTEEELNRKMQEAEAYFRILTQQVKVCYKLYARIFCLLLYVILFLSP